MSDRPVAEIRAEQQRRAGRPRDGVTPEWLNRTQTACVVAAGDGTPLHDWRLISEEPLHPTDEAGANYRRRWYCRRCRLVEEWASVL
jgi:hypothetical protein